jgi:DNA-binding MarR family transcriptional regulator
MKLTPRQQAFLDKLRDLYAEAQRPIHYSVVAQKLGVNRFSAYDMLKRLEEKGLVGSEYVLEEGNVGPGRSSILFFPLERAREAVARLTGDTEAREWEEAKTRILAALREGHIADKDLLNELLAAIPQTSSPLAYCARVMTALLLNARERIRADQLTASLNRLLIPNEASAESGLDVLAGFALGLSTTRERADREWERLVEYVRRYQRYVQALDTKSQGVLADFLREMLGFLGT